MNGLKFCCDIGDIIDCHKVVIVPTFDVGNKTIPQIHAETVRVINIMADYAAPRNMKLAFEFVGYPNCSVNTFGQAYDIIKAVNRENVGIVLDCFHFYSMRSQLADLEKADAKKIFIFHLDDSEDLPVGAARDDNRLMPGEGAIDLGRIFETLKKIGYDSMASIELFRPEYWEWPDDTTIRVSMEKTTAALSLRTSPSANFTSTKTLPHMGERFVIKQESGLFKKVFQFLAPAGMAQFSQRLCFDLTDTLARNSKFASHFLKRTCLAIVKTKAQTKHLLLARGQRIQHIHELFLERGAGHHLSGSRGVVIRNKISQMAIFLFANRAFPGKPVLARS